MPTPPFSTTVLLRTRVPWPVPEKSEMPAPPLLRTMHSETIHPSLPHSPAMPKLPFSSAWTRSTRIPSPASMPARPRPRTVPLRTLPWPGIAWTPKPWSPTDAPVHTTGVPVQVTGPLITKPPRSRCTSSTSKRITLTAFEFVLRLLVRR